MAPQAIDGRTVSAHSMPAGAQHGLGLRYVRGRLLRLAPPLPDQQYGNEPSSYRWGSWQFGSSLALQLSVALAGPVGSALATLSWGRRAAQNRGLLPCRELRSYTNLVFAAYMAAWLVTLPLVLAALRRIGGAGGEGVSEALEPFLEVALPLGLVAALHAVSAVSAAFLSPREMAWRRQHRRDATFLKVRAVERCDTTSTTSPGRGVMPSIGSQWVQTPRHGDPM
eukprot:COSAG01_NODE_1452_length_10260_cov_26.827970_2_plen_225_part_00